MRFRQAAAAAITGLLLSACAGDENASQAPLGFANNRLTVSATWGHSDQSHSVNADVLANGKRWRVTSDAPWATVPAGVTQGDATFAIDVDSTGIPLGAREARILLANEDDPAQTAGLILTLTVAEPQLTAPATLTLGGADGLDDSPQDYAFSLDTGTNAWPWSVAGISLVPDDVAWLELSQLAGTVDGSGELIVMDSDRDGLAAGVYRATVTLQFDVQGRAVTRTVDVTFNHEENRIYVVDNGIAFYDVPARSRLSASVPVLSSRDLLTVPWNAVSNQPWLTVTPSGTTGGLLDLQADTTGLAQDVVYAATVTISSPDPEIHNAETITVGLWPGSSDPGQLAIGTPLEFSVVNPVFPFVHASNNGTLRTWNTYTGDPVSTLALPYADSGGMAIGSDGRTIYVPDSGSLEVAGIDALSGQVVETLERASGSKVGYVRVKGHGIVTPHEAPWYFGFGPDTAAARDGRTLFFVDNAGPGHTFNAWALDYTALPIGEAVVAQALNGTANDTGNVRTLAVTADGGHYLAALSGSQECRLYDGIQQLELWDIDAYGWPNNAVARDDGLLICGSYTDDGDDDIQLLDFAGNELGTLHTAEDLLEDQMKLSSDPRRLVAPTDNDLIEVFELP